MVHYFPSKHSYKSIAGRYRPVRVADGPITARYRFIKNASWDMLLSLIARRWVCLWHCGQCTAAAHFAFFFFFFFFFLFSRVMFSCSDASITFLTF